MDIAYIPVDRPESADLGYKLIVTLNAPELHLLLLWGGRRGRCLLLIARYVGETGPRLTRDTVTASPLPLPLPLAPLIRVSRQVRRFRRCHRSADSILRD